ncbi:MAG: extracellular solute-binding protein [Lachnospiraceae bacterium]|jgi:ABC-type glycerol-3-phosphate transport system substrate-binding protein|nr:extracellular solute-binding protein [Lachnospiraceae bacterium]
MNTLGSKKYLLATAMIINALSFASCGNSNTDSVPSWTTEEISVANTETADETSATDTGNSYLVTQVQAPLDRVFSEAVFQNKLYCLGLGGEGNQAELVILDLDNPDAREITLIDLPENQEIANAQEAGIAVSLDGTVNLLIPQYTFGEEGYLEVTDLFWHRLDEMGDIANTVSAPQSMREGEAMILRDFEVDSDGNAYISMFYDFSRGSEESTEIFVLDPTGEVLFQATPRGFNYFVKGMDGKVYVFQYTTSIRKEGFNTWVVSLVDYAAGILNVCADVTDQAIGRISGLVISPAGVVFLTNGIGVYDCEGEIWTERFTWDGIKMRVDNGDRFLSLSEGKVLCVDTVADVTYSGPHPVSYYLIRRETATDGAAAEAQAEEWAERLAAGKVGDISLGAVGRSVDQAVSQAIDDFNHAHPYSKVTVKQYGTLYGDDQSEGLEKLNYDIIRGNCPDILLLPQDLSYGAYVAQGLFVDLYPYLQNDENINLADYHENVLRAYEVGGRLYGLPLSYGIETLYGRTAELAGVTAWDLDGLIAFADRFPDSQIFRYPTKTAVLDLCLRANGGNVVDWKSSGVGFDRRMMVKMLEFANRFADAERLGENRSFTERVEDGDVHLLAGYALPSLQEQTVILGAPATPVGYPSESGAGHLLYSDKVAAISSQCTYTETAWAFIGSLLDEKVQSGLVGYPLMKSCMAPRIEFAKEGGWSTTITDIEIAYEARGATDEDIELFLHMMDTVDTIRVSDWQIDAIVKEEAGAYFSGSKPVKEVADIIENRVGTYVKETKR